MPSGENQVFEAEQNLLRQHQHQVKTFIRHSDAIVNKGALCTLYGGAVTPINPWTAVSIRHKMKEYQPDVVHVHNTFPLLSPGIFKAIGEKTAKVLTLHNYRLFCPSAIPMRNGRTCTACLDSKSVWRSVVYGCYRGSRTATIPLALSVALHRAIGTWRHHVDAFIALSEFQKQIMIDAGLPAQRVHVKPNFYAGNPVPVPWDQRGEYAVFAGRLSAEKGVEQLIRAWLQWGDEAPELRIAGDGPLRESLERLSISSADNKIYFLGQMAGSDAEHQIAKAKLLILPSVWFETFGMAVLSGFAFGTPAAVSDIGPLPSIVKDGDSGVVFSPGDVDSLLEKIRTAWETPGYLEELGLGARRAFENIYTEDANYKMLMKIYHAAKENLQAKAS